MVKINQMLVSSRALTYPGTNPCNYIVIHETANTSKGANAKSHAQLQKKGFTASWHYTCGSDGIWQSYPDTVKCWHAGDGQGKGNGQGIGIEICVNSDGDFKKAVQNAAELVKHLMKKHNIPQAKVIQHNVTSSWGKDCPRYLRSGEKGVNWSDFNKMIGGASGGTTTVKPSKPKTDSQAVKNMSVVDYMKSKNMDASYSNRAKLAKQYGIKNYSGTAAQNVELLNKLKAGKPSKPEKPKSSTYKGNSIVDYLNSIDEPTSFSHRRELAKKHGFKNYTGTASQNLQLLNKLRAGGSGSKPKGDMKTNSIVDYLKSIDVNSSFANRKKLAAKHGIKNYSGRAGQNAQLLKKMRG